MFIGRRLSESSFPCVISRCNVESEGGGGHWVVTDLQRSVQRQVGVQEVLWFEVSMHDSVLVKILKKTTTGFIGT